MLNNIFSQIPAELTDEWIESLLEHESFSMERIVSRAHATPEGEWYDQKRDEWVLLVKGAAGLLFEGSEEPLTLKAGDYLLIPAHVRHRVEWTTETEDTVWLALHFSPLEDDQVE